MKQIIWLVILGALGTLGYAVWKWRQNWAERKRAAEERFASFVAQARPAAPAVTVAAPPAPTAMPDPTLAQQKLLLEAASKAGEAGEPALSIQLYARLLSRFPGSAFAAAARAAVEAQKKKLAKP